MPTTTPFRPRPWGALLSALLLATSLWAPSAHAEDPPTRAARVAETQGTTWVFDAESKEWQRLAPNQTLGEGDRIRTEPDGRLALRVGSTSLWVDASADVELSRLDEDHLELLVARGQLGLRLRNAEAVRELQVRTREGRFFFERKGLYRIDQLDRGSRAFNWEGELRFEARAPGTPPVWVQPNEQAEFWWGDGPRVERQALERDRFADWLLSMNRSEGDLPAYRYVSPEMTGAEDLDRHGRWESSDEYGTVWIPQQVAPDWAPYRYGRWVWTRHWGWTWVDDAPWGFAPFHYGRWVVVRERWCWVPGRYVPRPVYAPALVAWVGGPHVSVGITLGSRPVPRYGWYPLAPREVYVPSYRHTPHYEQRINREHDPVTVVPRGPAPPPRSNREVRGAITVWNDGVGRGMVAPEAGVPLRPLPQAPSRQEWRAHEIGRDVGVPTRTPPNVGPSLPTLPGGVAQPDATPTRRDVGRGRGDRGDRGDRGEDPGAGVPLRASPGLAPVPGATPPAAVPLPQVTAPATPAAPLRPRDDGTPLRRLPETPSRPESREPVFQGQAPVPAGGPDRALQERLDRERMDRERQDRERADRDRADRERQDRERLMERERQERLDRIERQDRQERQPRFEPQPREQRDVPMRQALPERPREVVREPVREPVRVAEPPRAAPPQRQEESRPARAPQQDNVPRKGRQDER